MDEQYGSPVQSHLYGRTYMFARTGLYLFNIYSVFDIVFKHDPFHAS